MGRGSTLIMIVRLFMRVLGLSLALVFSNGAWAVNGRLDVVKGEFRLTLDQGQVLERQALIGIRVVIGHEAQPISVLIDAVEEEASASGPVILYRLLVEDSARKSLHNLCQPDARGRQLGLPIPKGNGFDLTCTSGAEGKCILMGYHPWGERTDVPARDLHAACIHMVRADYGGDNHPTTRDGTAIDVYDRFGIQKPEIVDPMPFEAAWGREGALCVAHPRIVQNVTLEELGQRYERLRGRLGPEACTPEAMQNNPQALLFNRSAKAITR